MNDAVVGVGHISVDPFFHPDSVLSHNIFFNGIPEMSPGYFSTNSIKELYLFSGELRQ